MIFIKNILIALNNWFFLRLFPSLDISVKNIDRKSIFTIIGPLYKLRQACVHPQVIIFMRN
jgi:hypothetical protein